MKISIVVLAAAASVVLTSFSALPSSAAPGAAPPPAVSTAASYRISGPFSSGNLNLYLIHGADAANGAQYITLQEGLKTKQVVVHETGSVNELAIENKGTQLVFIQSGDIVKGGQQDRAVQFDVILPPKSGKVPLNSFCVEQGRWSKRGKESVAQFGSSTKQIVSKSLKIATKTPKVNLAARAGVMSGGSAGGAGAIAASPYSSPYVVPAPAAPALQGEVWSTVSQVQGKLGKATKGEVTAEESKSSLQLTLESDAVKKKCNTHIQALSQIVQGKRDVIGYAFAINGKVNSADVYASNALFLKLWPKLLDASATEAVSEESEKNAAPAPSIKDVQACLVDAEKAKPVLSTISQKNKLTTRQQTQDNKDNVLFETQTMDGASRKLWVHRNYVAK